ncbi:PepSY domain-containing protein [Litoreibacter janthinus]|uniref:NADPH--hemoprotein reductase n=1 Tax=Litoreibacter janthinus TaxID=670154 RepID=A0A1I6GDR3_9RHOB|nr:PepSY domain-containing protein [Litoreibacter janthinus]SFR40261.1 sulfite reductase (NADPH) flavoprotein alpha-component [Litoreibacter janthinus]
MIRALHRWPGLVAAVFLVVLSLSGAVLSVFPALDRISAPQAQTSLDVATLADRIHGNYPGVEQIRRAPSGRVTAYWFHDGVPGSAVIDPATGTATASADPNKTQRWLTELHRSLFLDDSGRMVIAGAALGMLLLTVSGAALVARRSGGWRSWSSPVRGPLAGRLHVKVARVAVVGLGLSSLTALWMSALTFELLPDTGSNPVFPSAVSAQMGVELTAIPLLIETKVSELRELTFPYAGDVSDVFTLKTDSGKGYIDQGTGAVLAWDTPGTLASISETIYTLHTGQGAPLLGLVMGLLALATPILAVTGALVWCAARRGQPRIRDNARAGSADTIVLVGSEGGSTWGFAATLHQALVQAGHLIHTAPMSAFNPHEYSNAERLIILTATYGDGVGPASATGFLKRLRRGEYVRKTPVAVLGFGDRSFPKFCAYGQAVAQDLQNAGYEMLLPFDTIDRQSVQDFARWGRDLAASMGSSFELDHQPVVPEVVKLTLTSRRDYGADVQAPTSILRFALPKLSIWQRVTRTGFARFEAGDLIGIFPSGSIVPRLYSLASGRGDGFVEIVVKKQSGGLCSGQLVTLEPGDTIQAFLRRNPNFHAQTAKTPLILVGAGTGVAPLAGIVRANTRLRPIHLLFGMRHLHSDFLYQEEISGWQADGKLHHLLEAESRGARPRYVQDVLRAEAVEMLGLIQQGAKVMVCGGREMAGGVASAMTDILSPVGLSLQTLKAEGRYVEDVY